MTVHLFVSRPIINVSAHPIFPNNQGPRTSSRTIQPAGINKQPVIRSQNSIYFMSLHLYHKLSLFLSLFPCAYPPNHKCLAYCITSPLSHPKRTKNIVLSSAKFSIYFKTRSDHQVLFSLPVPEFESFESRPRNRMK